MSQSKSESGGCFLLFLFALALGFLWKGGEEVWVAVTNLNPQKMTCQEFYQKGAQQEWITLSNCRPVYLQTIAVKGVGAPNVTDTSDFYTPLVPPHRSVQKPIKVLLHVRSIKKKKMLLSLFKIDEEGKKREEKIRDFADKHLEELTGKIEVSGMIRLGIDRDKNTRRSLEKSNLNLASGYVILNEGTAPSLWKGLAILAGGLMILAIAGYIFWTGGGNEEDDEEEVDEGDEKKEKIGE